MDEEKLKWLSRLETIYPSYQPLSSPDDFVHVYYLHEKDFVDLRWRGVKDIDDPGYILQLLREKPRQFPPKSIRVRITAHGLDAIKLLMDELKKQKEFIPEGSNGKLQAFFDSPIYKEAKDIAATFMAKLGSELSNK